MLLKRLKIWLPLKLGTLSLRNQTLCLIHPFFIVEVL